MTRTFDALLEALTDRDTERWSSMFVPDSVLVDHTTGQPDVLAAEWLAVTMAAAPCTTFSLEWAIADGRRGAAWLWFHLPDPDDAGIHYDTPSLLVVRLDPEEQADLVELFGPLGTWHETVEDWFGAVEGRLMRPNTALRPYRPSHPVPPDPPPDRAILEAVADALVTENWLDLVAWGARWHDYAGHPIERWADGVRTERLRVVEGARAVVLFDDDQSAAIVVHVDETGRVTFLDHLCDWSSVTA